MAKAKRTDIACPARIYDRIGDIIRNAEETQQAYFWQPCPTARQRRAAEKRRNCETVAWYENGDLFTAEFHYSESCHHVYAKGIYMKNGNKTTLKAVKASFDRLLRIPDDEFCEYFILNEDEE